MNTLKKKCKVNKWWIAKSKAVFEKELIFDHLIENGVAEAPQIDVQLGGAGGAHACDISV